MNPQSVLIVDDSPNDRHALRVLLGAVGIHGVREAESGDDGLRIASEWKPGVVILDARMPGMSGEEAAGHIRQEVPGARIIAFSAYVERPPAWADYFLRKDQLSEMVPLIKMVLGC
ncbi:MAG TPA: response regulator [Actinomycetota bacterium]|jgi:NarL family two-component system response regulator LiaR